MKSRVSKHRAGGRWSEARYFSFIRSALRRASGRWPVKQDVKEANKRLKPKGREGRHRFEYNCKQCNDWFPDKLIAVDHIRPTGSLKTYEDLPRFVETLFCESDNLQILCHKCHTEKTKQEREERKK